MIAIETIEASLRSSRRRELARAGLRRSAVLIPLFEKNGELHLLLTQRSDEVEHHKGQISFPGGMREETDPSPTATALREADEEIGLPPSAVNVLGMLDDLATPTGFLITPVVGHIPSLPPLTPHKREVDQVFDVPLSFFLDPANECSEQHIHEGVSRTVIVYPYASYRVWGATAAIIRSFILLAGQTKNPL